MAEAFEVVSQRLTQEIVGGHDLIDVWEIGARSRPSNIYFVFRVGQDEHDPETISARASQLAAELERVAMHANVSQVAYVQSIGGQGQLVDEIDVHYATMDMRHSGAVRTPLRDLSAETVCRHVEDQVAHLAGIAQL